MVISVFYERRKEVSPVDLECRETRDRRDCIVDSPAPDRRRLATQIRRHEREEFQIPVTLKMNQREFKAVTHDVSPSGFLLISDSPIAPGTPMSLRFSFGDNVCYLNVSGQVAFSQLCWNGTPDKYANGIKFSAIRNWEQEILNSAVRKLKEDFFSQGESILTIIVAKDILAIELRQASVLAQERIHHPIDRRVISIPIGLSDRRSDGRRQLNRSMELERRQTEKRENGRSAFYRRVFLQYGGYRQEAWSRNLSNKGVFIVTPDKNSVPEVGSKISVGFYMSSITDPITIPFEVTDKRSFGIMHGVGCKLTGISSNEQMIELFDHAMSQPNPAVYFEPQDHSCHMFGVDLTIGCEHACVYCHFYQEKQSNLQEIFPGYKEFPLKVDLSPIYKMRRFPGPTIYLSPSSDPFAPSARDSAHEMLGYLLPKGLHFAISTKNVIPDKTLDLVAQHRDQVEIAVGFTNIVDEERNTLVEPGCPPVSDRLAGLHGIVNTGCTVDVRMDPLIPTIDDTDEVLEKTIDAIAKTGAQQITASYVFSFGRFLKQLRGHPYFKKAVELLTEKTPVSGGVAFGVPWDDKMEVYSKIENLCRERNMRFHLCSCKDKRLEKKGTPIICRSNK